jgi:hypothetical protein
MNVVHLIMQVKIQTNFGKQENRDVIINEITLENVSPWQEGEALEKGFALYIEDGDEYWYMARNTRVHLLRHTFQPIELEWEVVDEQPKVFKKILNDYLQHNKFSNIYAIDEKNERFKYIVYKVKGKIVAITKLLQYNNNVETYAFIWDYKNPEMRLGEKTLEHELWWAKKEGYQCLYTGSGYEKSSIYKANIPGFQWWTGMEWSSDVEKYKELCLRDSKIRSFKALTSLDLPEHSQNAKA